MSPMSLETTHNEREVSLGDISSIDEDEMDEKIRNLALYNPEEPNLPRDHEVVTRLSHWEGGKAFDKDIFNKPARGKLDEEERKISDRGSAAVDNPNPTVTIRDVVKVFVRSDSLLIVEDEDIERVKIMHDTFLESSQFSFNYNVMLGVSSILAALGLGSNSVATIIASMLVSPLMGPVVGMGYANTIRDYKMFRIGFVTEVISLFVCIIMGAIVGACMLPFSISDDWPTPEMYNRGTSTNFWVGFPVAFFSGLGVAVSLLDEQTSALVGVAISASLLPPAVNAGMILVSYVDYDRTRHSFDHQWDAHDFLVMSLYSLGLTLINVVLIIIASMIMFRVKERLPIKKSIFWSDLGVARKIYRNLAIIPRVQAGPSPQELQNRASKLTYPRVSEVNFGASAPQNNGRVQVTHESVARMSTISKGLPSMERLSASENVDSEVNA